jgi:hypothetical protein
MSTAQCVEAISQTWWLSMHLAGADETDPKDWKRVNKRKGNDDTSWVRTFEYKPTGEQFVFVTNEDDDAEDDYTIIDAGDWLYSIYEDEGEQVLSLNPEAFWNREKALYDQQVTYLIHALTGFDVDDFDGDEDMENHIIIPNERVEFLKLALDAGGFKKNAEMDAFVASVTA